MQVDLDRSLPTGTVTFLFSDIEGSTRLVQDLGDRYAEVLERHQTILRSAFAGHDGTEVGTEGDSFFVVFPSAPDAVAAAVDGERESGDGALARRRADPRADGVAHRRGRLRRRQLRRRRRPPRGTDRRRGSRRPDPDLGCHARARRELDAGRDRGQRPRHPPIEGPPRGGAHLPGRGGRARRRLPPARDAHHPTEQPPHTGIDVPRARRRDGIRLPRADGRRRATGHADWARRDRQDASRAPGGG